MGERERAKEKERKSCLLAVTRKGKVWGGFVEHGIRILKGIAVFHSREERCAFVPINTVPHSWNGFSFVTSDRHNGVAVQIIKQDIILFI